MADGDSDVNRQAFTKLGADPFVDIKGKIENGAMKWYCGCQKSGATGDQQDATRYALRLHGAQFKWRFRCNDQPGFALCQKPGPAE